jgi:hypothetical protein
MNGETDPLDAIMTHTPPPRTKAQREAAATAKQSEPPVAGIPRGATPDTAHVLEAPARRKYAQRTKCSFDLATDLAESFRALCSTQGVQQRDVVEKMLRAYVAHHSDKASQAA